MRGGAATDTSGSGLGRGLATGGRRLGNRLDRQLFGCAEVGAAGRQLLLDAAENGEREQVAVQVDGTQRVIIARNRIGDALRVRVRVEDRHHRNRSEEHTSELQSLMRISYAVFCLKK